MPSHYLGFQNVLYITLWEVPHHEYIMPMLYILEQVMTSIVYVLANVFVIFTFPELSGFASCIHSFILFVV